MRFRRDDSFSESFVQQLGRRRAKSRTLVNRRVFPGTNVIMLLDIYQFIFCCRVSKPNDFNVCKIEQDNVCVNEPVSE